MSKRRVSRRTLHRRTKVRGSNTTAPRISTEPTTEIETFPNPTPERDYEIAFECPEFTCLCPLTG